MRIENKSPEVQLHDTVRSVQPASAASAATAPARPVEKSDRVELSPEARALAARLDDGEADTLAPERIAELRRKVQEGEYHRPEMIEAVVRRLLDSGDL